MNRFSKICVRTIFVILILVGVFLIYAFPSHAEEDASLKNPLQTESLSSLIFQWSKVLFFAILGFIPALLVAFGTYYLIIWGGLKLLHIENISISRIVVFILLILFFGLLLNFVIPIIYLLAALKTSIVFYSVVFLIFALVIFLFSKYYFKLSGKKLWQFFLYFAGIGLIFTIITSQKFMPKLFVEKAEEQFGPSLKSEVKPGEDVYKNEKYNFEIKYFTDQFAIEKDYETERLHQEPKLLFEAIFNDTKYGWNVGKTTSQPAMTIRVFECLESTLDGCVSEISCLQPFEYSPESYRKVITDPLTEFNTFPAKQLEVAEHSRLTSGATIFEGEDKREGMMIFKENHLYVILVLTSSEIFQPIPKDILNQMLSTFRFIEVEETANWKTFKNEDYGFEVKYPQNWLPHNLSPIEGVFRISFWDKDCSIECGSIEINIKNRNNKSFQQIKQETENKYSLVFLPQVFPFKETKVDKEQAFIIPGYEFILGVVTVVHEGYIYEISRTYSEEDVPEELFNQILSTFRFLE